MTIHTTQQPVWYSLSHHGRYRRLQKVRRVWCRCQYAHQEDSSGRIVHLDGTWINDIPSFHLSLGEAINGPNGYFGGGLDALEDCLNGGFGVTAPLTVRLSRFDEVRQALDGRAWCRWEAEGFQQAITNEEYIEQIIEWGYLGDGSPAEIERRTAIYEAALAGQPFDFSGFGSYFDVLLEIFEARGSYLIPAEGEISK